MIRAPTDEEVPEMVALGHLLHRHSSYASLGYDIEKVTTLMFTLLDDDEYIRGDFAEDGRMRGFMLGVCRPAYFSSDLIANDLVLVVNPEATNGTTAFRLIRDFVKWARAKGAKQIRPGVTTGQVSGGAEQLYELLGFTRVGSAYVMEV